MSAGIQACFMSVSDGAGYSSRVAAITLIKFGELILSTKKEQNYNKDMHKAITITRDYKGRFTSKELKTAEDFVGGADTCDAEEIGIDDQYTMFFWSNGTPANVVDWVFDNDHHYTIWHLLEDGVSFKDLADFVERVNELGSLWDEEWEPLCVDVSEK